MDYVIIGSTAVKYWYEKCLGEQYFHIPHDKDITAFDKSREELKLLNAGDVILNDGTELNKVRQVVKDIVVQDGGEYYMTPEALSIYYLSRPRKFHFQYPYYLKDVFRLQTLKKIMIARGTYADFKKRFYDAGFDDYKLIFYLSPYFYRLNMFRGQRAVIGGEWAIMVYQELLANKKHYIHNLDIHVYNSPVRGNRCGSMVIPDGPIESWVELGDFKLEPITRLIKLERRRKVRLRLLKIFDENLDLLNNSIRYGELLS